jgi:predicted RNase H-like nuclease (RuvC/YqgF family)
MLHTHTLRHPMDEWLKILAAVLGGAGGAKVIQEAFKYWTHRGDLDFDREKAQSEVAAVLWKTTREDLERLQTRVHGLEKELSEVKSDLWQVSAERSKLQSELELCSETITVLRDRNRELLHRVQELQAEAQGE